MLAKFVEVVGVVSDSAVDSMGGSSDAVVCSKKGSLGSVSMSMVMALFVCVVVLISVRGVRLAGCSEGHWGDEEEEHGDDDEDDDAGKGTGASQDREEYEMPRLREGKDGFVLDMAKCEYRISCVCVCVCVCLFLCERERKERTKRQKMKNLCVPLLIKEKIKDTYTRIHVGEVFDQETRPSSSSYHDEISRGTFVCEDMR